MKIIDSQIKQIVYQLHHNMNMSYNKLALLLSTSICKKTIIQICKNSQICKNLNNNLLEFKQVHNNDIIKKNNASIKRITNKSRKINLIKATSQNKKLQISSTKKESQNIILQQKQKQDINIQNTISNNSHQINIPSKSHYNVKIDSNINFNDFTEATFIKQCYTYSNNTIIPIDNISTPPDHNKIGTISWHKQVLNFKPIIKANVHAQTPNLTTPIFFDHEFNNWIINNQAINNPNEFKQFKNNNIVQSNIFNYIQTFNPQHDKIYNGLNIQRVKKCLALYYYKTFNFIVPETILYDETIKLLNIIKEHNWLNKEFHNIENLKLTLQKLIDFNPTKQTNMKMTYYFLAFYYQNK